MPQSNPCDAPLASGVDSTRAVLKTVATGLDIAPVGLAAGGVTGALALGTKALGIIAEADLGAVNGYDAYGIPNSTNLGRFVHIDPIGYEDQWNLYAYVGNDPVNKIDPTGEKWACVTMEGQKLDCRDIPEPNLNTISVPSNGDEDSNDGDKDEPEEKVDFLDCAGQVALGAIGGGLNPVGLILEGGEAFSRAVNRTAPEDALLKTDKRSRISRDTRSAARIGLSRALSAAAASPQARAVSAGVGEALVLLSSKSCGIEAIPPAPDILPVGF